MSLERITGVDPGFDPQAVATFRVSLDAGSSTDIVQYYQGLIAALEDTPGVVAAGAAQTLPLNPAPLLQVRPPSLLIAETSGVRPP